MRAWATRAAFAAAWFVGGCATAPAPVKTPLTVVLTGDEPPASGVRRALLATSGLPVELRMATLPNVAAPARDTTGSGIEASLATARKAYVEGQFGACEQAIAGDGLVVDLLGQGQRAQTSRLLFWRIACKVGAGMSVDALAVARELAVLGLDAPPEVGMAAPEVEAALARAAREVAQTPKAALRVTVDRGEVSVSIDGRSRACVTPCVLQVAPGDHVVGIEADGIVTDARKARADGARTEVVFRATPASPDLAAQQWTTRYARSAAVDSSPSMRLLALAIRAPRLALVSAEGGQTERLRGTFAVDGAVDARAERLALEHGGAERETPGLLRELLVRGKILEPAPRLYQRPAFWLAVGVVAAGAVLGTYLVVHQPPGREQVVFQ